MVSALYDCLTRKCTIKDAGVHPPKTKGIENNANFQPPPPAATHGQCQPVPPRPATFVRLRRARCSVQIDDMGRLQQQLFCHFGARAEPVCGQIGESNYLVHFILCKCFTYQRHEQQTKPASVHASHPIVDNIHADICVSSRGGLCFIADAIVDAAAGGVHAAVACEADQRGGLTLLRAHPA